MGRLDGKTAIITGASRGVGRATATAYVNEGATVVIADIEEERNEKLAAELGEAAVAVHCDVGDEGDWANLVDVARRRAGRIDVLANVAGALYLGLLVDTPLDEYLRVNRVNEVGTFLGIKTVAPVMAETGGGSIINYSSVAAFHVSPFTAAYVASKYAIRGLTHAAAMELGGRGIRVNTVCGPGGSLDFVTEAPHSEAMAAARQAQYEMAKGAGLDAGWGERSAPTMVFLASDESAGYNGADFVLDGGNSVGTTVERIGQLGR